MVERPGPPGGHGAGALTEPAVLRDDDPRVPPLLAAGWTVAHRSWAARLTLPDERGPLEALVAVAAAYRIDESAADAELVALAAATREDFPGGPATAPRAVTARSIAADRATGTRWFVARDAAGPVAATAIRAEGERAETDWTAVLPAHRRRGLAEAVKAASVLALAQEGVREFGTGGAAENTASLAMNRRLGYVVTERWLTLVAPA